LVLVAPGQIVVEAAGGEDDALAGTHGDGFAPLANYCAGDPAAVNNEFFEPSLGPHRDARPHDSGEHARSEGLPARHVLQAHEIGSASGSERVMSVRWLAYGI